MPISAAEPLLQVKGITSGYGKIGVLHGVDMSIAAGEVVALLGPNGAGKTTLLRTISGLIPWTSGSVHFEGSDSEWRGAKANGAPGTRTCCRRAPRVHAADGDRQFASGRL